MMASQLESCDICIVGAGIVGSALAYHLSSSDDGKKVILIDRDFSSLKGSTGYAPGFVGQFNESEVLTNLAVESVREYLNVPGGFEVVGGLEIALTDEGVAKLQSRHEMAKKAGLSAELISAEQAATMAPDLVKKGNKLALHFPSDGAANAIKIATYFQQKAREGGVELVETDVTGIQQNNGHVNGVVTSSGPIRAKAVVIATGIWATQLSHFDLPIPVIPVAHPYMYGEYHELKSHKSPWVRWPEYHVYSRDHGHFYGLGSYQHKPVFEEPKESAKGNWIEEFDATLKEALKFIPEETKLAPREKFNGIFSMTPDNMPLVGEVSSIEGVYMAAAVWVTHAAGAAKFLAQTMRGQPVDEKTKRALDPNRFKGRDMRSLKQESLDGYNNIYRTDESTEKEG